MANEDVVWLDVLPSLSGFTRALRSGLSGASGDAARLGREAGSSYGSGFTSGAEAGLRAAQDRVQAVEKRLADAKGSLAVAQTRLTDAQNKGTTSAGTLAAAQERVEKAERTVSLTETQLVRARQDVTVATRAASDATERHSVAVSDSNQQTEKAPGLIEKFSSGWIKAAAVMGTVTYAAYGIKQAFGALYSTIDVASGLNEEINKSRVVFGNASQSVIDFTNNAARGMGQSRLEALQSTGIFGNLFRAVGLTTDQSAQMSTRLVQLAADLASFNNADPSEVLLAMRAGLVGESEPMRRFGVDLSDLALRQEAANLGIYKGTGVLNQAQKAQAAYSLLLKQTTLAQGDFVRTSAGLANSTRILHGEWTDLKGAIGGLLLGPATGVVHWLNDLLPQMSANIEGLHKFGQAFADGFHNASASTQASGLGKVFETLGAQVRSTTEFLDHLVNMVAGAFRVGMQTAAPLVSGLGGAFNNLIGSLTVVSSHWHDLITNVVQAFLPVIRTLVPLVAQLAATFAGVLMQGLQAVAPALSVLADVAGQVATALSQALVGVIRQLQPILPVLGQALGDVATTLGNGLLVVVKALAPVMATWAQTLGQVAQILAGVFTSAVRTLAPVLPVLATAFADIAKAVAGALAQALGALAPVLPQLARSFADIASAVGGALAQAIGAIAPVLPPLVEAFVKLFESAVQPLLPLLPTLARVLGDVAGAIVPLVPVAANVVAALAQLATAVLPALNPLLEVVGRVIGIIADAFAKLPGPVQLVLGAFLVLKTTIGVNIFSATITGLAGLTSAFQTNMPRITGLTTGMVTAVKGELASMSASFAAAKVAQQELVASNYGIGVSAVPKAVGDLAGIEAAAKGVATRGFGALKTAGSGLLSFFGGPWGAAIAGVGIGLVGLIDLIVSDTEATKKTKAATEEWTQALQAANGVIDENVRKQAAKALQDAGVLDVAQRAGISLSEVTDAVTGEGSALDDVRRRLQAYIEQHTTTTTAVVAGKQATVQYKTSLDDQGKAAHDALGTLGALAGATDNQSTKEGQLQQATETATTSQRNQTQALQDYVDTQLGAVDATLGYQSSVLNVKSAIEQYNQGINDGTLKGTARAQAENSLAQSIQSSTEAAGRAAVQQLGPNADASAKSTAAVSAEKAAFEGLVGMLGYIPPSLQATADALGVTTGDLQAHQNSGVDPLAQAYGALAVSTVQGIVLPAFGQIPGAMQPANDALDAQRLGVLPNSAAGWATYVDGVTKDILGAFGLGGTVPAALDNTNGALNNQSTGPLTINGQSWHDYVARVQADIFGLFGQPGGAGALPGAVAHANASLDQQAGQGGSLHVNEDAWHQYSADVGDTSQGLFAAGGTVPGAIDNTNTALGNQAGPLAANRQSWHDYVAGVTADILGLFGQKGGSGALPGALANGQVHLDAYQQTATGDLGVVNAAFATHAATATTQMGLVEAHIYGPMTTALAAFSTQATTHTGIVNAAFTGMQTTTTARMTDVENHVYGPMTSSLVSMHTTASTMTTGVVNSFTAMSTGVINASNTAATGIGAAFNRIRAGVAGPVNFVVVNAIGGALIPAFNNVAAAVGIAGIGVGLPTVKLADGGPVPGFADGGPIGGPYIGPKADNVPGFIAFSGGGVAPVRLNPREFIQPVASVDQYGLGFMEAVRTGAFPTAIARAYAEGGRIPGFAQGGMTYPTLEAWVRANLPGAVITSAYRPGAADLHGAGDAVDISYPGNPQSRNMPAAAKIAATFGGISELIHNPNESIKNGRVVPPSFWGAATWAQHANHVHWAMTPQALAGKGVPVSGAGGPVGIVVNGQLLTSSGQVGALLNNAVNGPLGQLTGSFGSNQLTRYLTDFTHSLTNRVFGAVQGRVDAAIQASAATATGGGSATGPVADIVRSVFATRGWGSGAQWNGVNYIVSHESGWNPGAQNPSSTASGLFQEIDATWRAYRRKSAAAYPKMRLAPVNEQAWGGLNYIAGRFGSPTAAQAFWAAHHYYDDGGILGDGMSGSNASGFDERVLSPRQTVAFERLVNVLDRGTAPAGGPSHLTGDLYLDSGEFMGTVRGVVASELGGAVELAARNVRSA